MIDVVINTFDRKFGRRRKVESVVVIICYFANQGIEKFGRAFLLE